MRIIAGSLKGRRLRSPTWSGVRPTSDRLRETLFNVLGDRVRGARVLDGYAGTGALGLEALSRGAGEVVFIERDPRAEALIRRNIDHCGVAAGYGIIRGALPAALRRAGSLGRFDLILLDPPYDGDGLSAVLAGLCRHLAPDGLLVLERAKRGDVRQVPGLTNVRTVRSGDSALDFYQRVEPLST
jgi:16S rRNA (guanine(966)-N(2))-methyltransferase RsmD